MDKTERIIKNTQEIPFVGIGTFNLDPSIKKIEAYNPLGASLLQLYIGYYKSVLRQAQQSFLWALIAALIGLVFFVAAISFLLTQKSENISYVSVICGSVIEIISGLNFYLYGRASSQLKDFHQPLDRIQRFILANDFCNHLNEKQDEVRAKLILTIVNTNIAVETDNVQNESNKD